MSSKLASLDGHLLRSRGEVIIDDWLHYHDIKHEYEKAIFYSPTGYFVCDWYLPNLNVYLEYWGIEESKTYTKSRRFKEKIYRKQKLHLISIENSDLTNLDKKLGKLTYLQCYTLKSNLDQTQNIPFSRLISLRNDTKRKLIGFSTTGSIIKPLQISYTQTSKKYGLIYLIHEDIILKTQIWADYNQKNINKVMDLPYNSIICIRNPIIPPRNYHSSDLWVSEVISNISILNQVTH